MLDFLWAKTIWILYMWRWVKQLRNSGAETSGAAGLEPNSANCNKNVENLFFSFDMWFFITQALQMAYRNSDNSAFNYSTTSVSGSFRDPPKPLRVLSQFKTAPLGWFNPKSQRKSEIKSTELISGSVAGPLKGQKMKKKKKIARRHISQFLV